MANTNQTPAKKEGTGEYIKGVKKEMSKVIWPSRKELVTYTIVVLATCAVFALGFWLIDTGVIAALRGILGITLN